MQLSARTALKLSVALFTLGASFNTEAAWDLNDVSFLLPLPQAKESALLFRANSPSDQKLNLIPKSVYAEIVATIEPASQEKIRDLYTKWAAVAYRVDGCFHEHDADPCEKQVRVSWQPVTVVNGVGTAENAALHTFYPVSDKEWPKLLATLRKIRSLSKVKTAGLPLGVHPGFADDGLSGAFSKKFHKLMKPWILQSRINVIAMVLPMENGEMIFRRFHDFGPKAVNRLQAIWITYANELEIRYGNRNARGEETRSFMEQTSGLLSPLRYQDDLRLFLANSEAIRSDRTALLKFAEIQRRTVDPKQHLPLTIDCLSCHMTGAVGSFMSRELTDAEKDSLKSPPFKNPGTYNLTNTSAKPGSPVRIRAIGYEGAEISLLDRVINESALVAESLNHSAPIR